MSLSSLLHLEELLRKILLFPQSAKVKEFTVERITSKGFSISECLQGLVTAEDLNLDTATEIFSFIMANLGNLVIRTRKSGPCTETCKFLKIGSLSMTERFKSVFSYIDAQVVKANNSTNPSYINVIGRGDQGDDSTLPRHVFLLPEGAVPHHKRD